MIKRIIFIFLGVLLITGCGVYKNNISYCQYLGGYWGQWQNYYQYDNYGGYGIRWAYRGEKDKFVVYKQGDHPSDFSFRITILSFDENKLPKDGWEEYRGYVEYHSFQSSYSSGDSEYFVKHQLPELSSFGHYVIKRWATINVKRGSPSYTYNVFFDNVGFGVTIPWKYSK